MTRLAVSVPQARRIALSAQGFGARPARVGLAALRRTADRLALVQIDSVNVVTRSQYLPFFSRLGPYDPEDLDRLRDGDARGRRHLVEYWGHEASLMPTQLWPVFGFRMRRAHAEAWNGMRRVAAEHPALVRAVREEILARGPATARRVQAALAHDEPRRTAAWGWNWSLVKAACEHLFWAGDVTSAGRNRSFERRYADPALVLGAEVVDRGPRGDHPVAPQDAFDTLIEVGARAHGVGTAACLTDYARLPRAEAAAAIARLVETGVLVPADVGGLPGPWYLHHEARLPRRVSSAALLSPFDSLVWSRPRIAALFGFHYRLEIYVPAAKRVHGYYVLPFLLGDTLVGRVDVRADRAAGVLRVVSVQWEERALARGADAPEALREQLGELARFLRLERVELPGG